MNLTKIFNTEKLPGRRLRSVAQFAMRDSRLDFGEILVHSRAKLARQCAEMIADEKEFFDVATVDNYASVQVDVVLMTHKELTNLMREQFNAGQRHAMGFMPTHMEESTK